MSFRAQMQRMAYIDNRLRYRRDYPSARRLVQGVRDAFGEEPSERTVKRDIEKLRERGAPIE